MSTDRRPDLTIKVYPENMVQTKKINVLQQLLKTNALILHLQENIKGNVFNSPYPFITFKRVSSSEKLPENLKKDGDPYSDYFITLGSFKANVSSRNSSSSSMFSFFFTFRVGAPSSISTPSRILRIPSTRITYVILRPLDKYAPFGGMVLWGVFISSCPFSALPHYELRSTFFSKIYCYVAFLDYLDY